MSTIRFRLLIIAAALVFAGPFAITSLSVAQQPPDGQTENVKNEDCVNCKDGSCQDCKDKCQQGECDEAASEVAVAKTDADRNKTATLASTHKQTSTLTPKLNGRNALLSTFRVHPDGQIVACVSASNSSRRGIGLPGIEIEDQDEPAADNEEVEPDGFIQIYSPDFEISDQFGLPFRPTALDIDKSGNMFVAGDGIICKLTPDGEIAISCDSPNMKGVDMDELKEEIKQEMEQQQQETQKMFDDQIQGLTKQIKTIEEIDEADRSNAETSDLQTAKSQLEMYENMLERQKDAQAVEHMIEQRIKSSSNITAVAVTDQDVFVATSARTGSGYEVYRMTHNLTEPECVLKRLRGCCGQMDIHAVGDKIYVAENTKFNVGIYDREGKKVSSFGRRLNKDNQGFGSCCNPMNVLCCENGDILTAESSIGKIKRFDSDGNLVEYVGRARIGGGCKHVAFGFDEKLDRYYVQYEDNNQICILAANDAQPEQPANPEIGRFAKRLTQGKWQLSSMLGSPNAQEVVEGVGIQIHENANGEIAVENVIPGSPADQKGMNKGDLILAVGDFGIGDAMTDTQGMELADVANMLQGSAGSWLRIKYRSADSHKTRRVRLGRVRMERIDDRWVVQNSGGDDAMFGGLGYLTNMKSLEFADDGSVKLEMQSNTSFGSSDSFEGMKWLATNVDGETLLLDIESSEDMIMYRVKVKFTDDDQTQIALTYDGIGEEGEFRDYRLVRHEEGAANQSTETANKETNTDSSNK